MPPLKDQRAIRASGFAPSAHDNQFFWPITSHNIAPQKKRGVKNDLASSIESVESLIPRWLCDKVQFLLSRFVINKRV
jgi:hypothetical protein